MVGELHASSFFQSDKHCAKFPKGVTTCIDEAINYLTPQSSCPERFNECLHQLRTLFSHTAAIPHEVNFKGGNVIREEIRGKDLSFDEPCFVIGAGPTIFLHSEVVNKFDFCIFLDVNADDCASRRYMRNGKSRPKEEFMRKHRAADWAAYLEYKELQLANCRSCDHAIIDASQSSYGVRKDATALIDEWLASARRSRAALMQSRGSWR